MINHLRVKPVIFRKVGYTDWISVMDHADWMSVMHQFYWPKQGAHRHYTGNFWAERDVTFVILNAGDGETLLRKN